MKNKALADEMTAEEVQHWATVPRREFDQAVSQQLAISEALTELRKRSKVPVTFIPDTHERRVALAWLINHQEVKIPTEEELNYVPPDPSELSKSARKRIAKLEALAFKKAARRSKGGAEGSDLEGNESESGLEDASIAGMLATNVPSSEAVKADVQAEAEVDAGAEAGARAGVEANVEGGSDAAAPVVKRELPAWAVSIQDDTQGITPALLKFWKPSLSAIGKISVALFSA